MTSIRTLFDSGCTCSYNTKLRNQDYQYSGTISEIYNFASKGTSALGLDEYRGSCKNKIDTDQDIPLKTGYVFNVQIYAY